MKTLMMSKLRPFGSLRFYADLFPIKVFLFSESLHLPIFFHKNFFSFIFRILSSNISLSVNQKNAVDCKDIMYNKTFITFNSGVSAVSLNSVSASDQKSITGTIILFSIDFFSKKECYQTAYPLKALQRIHEGFSRAPPINQIHYLN